MALKPQILSRIVELGGRHGDSDLTLDPALRAIRLPPLARQNDIHTPREAFTDKHRQKAETLLENAVATKEEFSALLKPFINFVHIRTFDGAYFRPFDLAQGWGDLIAPEAHFREIVKAETLEFVELAIIEGSCPDLYYICLSDGNPANPTLYATDHETSWSEGGIYNMGTLNDWLGGLRTLRQATAELMSK